NYFSRLNKGGISGLFLNGDFYVGIRDLSTTDPLAVNLSELTPAVECAPVFLARPTTEPDTGLEHNDIVDGVDEVTSVSHKLRLIASVINSPRFRDPLFNFPVQIGPAPKFYDARYMIGGLEPSTEPFHVGDGLDLPPNPYAIYVDENRFTPV